MKKEHMIGVDSKETANNITLSSKTELGKVTFYKSTEELRDEVFYRSFISNVEYLVRTDKRYKQYIAYLTNELDPPLNHCMLYSNIKGDDVKVEMHHGPVLKLFDVVEIILLYYMKNNRMLTSIALADIVIKEHLYNNVQVVMLSQMAHKAMHPKKQGVEPKFLDHRHAHGNIVAFIEKYYQGLALRHVANIQRYNERFSREMNKPDTFFDEIVTIWTKEIFGN